MEPLDVWEFFPLKLLLDSSLLDFVRRIRHSPFFTRHEQLVRTVKRLYCWVMDPFQLGVKVLLPDLCTYGRVPAKYFDLPWSTYEPENLVAAMDFVRQNPDTLILDVGASIGQFLVACLSSSQNSKAIAFESDIASLISLEEVCRYQEQGRIQKVYGLISNEHGSRLEFAEATARCEAELANARGKIQAEDREYLCISPGQTTASCPIHCLTGLFHESELFRKTLGGSGKILLKIDVEGAEFLVLKGAEAFLKEFRPTIALSVHWYWLENFKTSREEIMGFLSNIGYQIKLLATDHEEHWWCQPTIKLAKNSFSNFL